ncbi:ArsR/SmtB family transcription factor [Sulfuracidifex tepidarius]|uniref:HTH arsR-type domain-containing protein n=1 Tax=Sulfuracidifex tepidarius TaxID=1294262 RepID=A0A510DRK8_9CREN|nr:metalloregulator ArsR/SmtB family transcription factor [Sulfuracidifex tepidarius]BBG22794.1 hypothetical protein IC006_0078 [Sulfuracidifex tepidarius]BBG25571.1 hypothetical protein IC007_0076 [Sulfuracidifex tepidarius]
MINELAKLFSCMADENRLKIILYLSQRREASVGEIAKATNNYQSLVSHHLSTLRKAGIVNKKRIGKNSVYVISEQAVKLIEFAESLSGVPPLDKKMNYHSLTSKIDVEEDIST